MVLYDLLLGLFGWFVFCRGCSCGLCLFDLVVFVSVGCWGLLLVTCLLWCFNSVDVVVYFIYV